MPFAVGCGFAGGGLREVCPKDAIWHFSPLFFIDLHRHAWRLIRFKLDWLMILLAAPIGLELLRQALGARFGDHLFCMAPPHIWLGVLVVLATVLSVAIPIKIWNTARIEHRLQEQEKLLMSSRVEALASQINPHFLFNTLASISSLIRSQPETARVLIVKLSGLLRRLLRSRDVEGRTTVRDVEGRTQPRRLIGGGQSTSTSRRSAFGPTLVVEKDISPDSLDLVMPSMLLQPLVENAIKHGIGQKIGGGQITIRSHRETGHTVIETFAEARAVDNGGGMNPAELDPSQSGGIGCVTSMSGCA